jgi:hypothetical protein
VLMCVLLCNTDIFMCYCVIHICVMCVCCVILIYLCVIV